MCGKTFTTERGMKIHRTKKGCLKVASMQRSEPVKGADKTSETSSLDANHSAGSLQSEKQADEQPGRPERIKFPQASLTTEWEELDKELSNELKQKVCGSIAQKIAVFGKTIYEFCRAKYGIVSRPGKKSHKQSRRQRNIEDIRRQKKIARKQWKDADDSEKPGLKALWEDLKKRHSELCKAERICKKKREKAKCRQEFLRGPFQFARRLFEQPRSGVLGATKDELEEHLRNTYSDTGKNRTLEDLDGTTISSAPKVVFDLKPPRITEVRNVVRKARCKSAPGPNGVPYLVYKKCPEVLKRLHGLLVCAWRQRTVSEEWTKADGVYIPKEKDSKTIGQFRPISLLNVEGKIFFSVIAQRLTKYLLDNGYIDTTVQKGGVPGVPGCLEHSTMIWEAIQRAKRQKLDLHVIWLDLANAYGAVPHCLLWKALEMHHVPLVVVDILKQYFNAFKMRYSTPTYTTDWTQLEVGIAMGCTVSPVLFVLAMQVLLKAAEAETELVDLGQSVRMPPLKAFMDDTTVITNSRGNAQAVLNRLDTIMEWGRMKFKPAKSRSLSIKEGKVDDQVVFRISGQAIPTVSQVPVKSLGRWYSSSLRDSEQSKLTKSMAEEGLEAINKTLLQGKHKLWIVQFMLIPKLLWPLQVYEIGLSAVEAIEKKIGKYTRKWLGLPPGLTSVALYSRNAKLRLPLKALTEEFQIGKVRLQMMLKYSKDPAVRVTGAQLKTGRKWKASEATNRAEEAAKFKEILGAVQTGRQGLGFGKEEKIWWSRASDTEKRELVIGEVRNEAEAKRYQTAVQQGQQGQWTTWEEVIQRSLSWSDIWQATPFRLSFLIRAAYDQLPSANNLVRWNLAQDDKCPLCGGSETLQHVLSACKTALANGRYTWRHNQVLAKVLQAVDEARSNCASQSSTTGSLLDGACDWKVAADLPGKGVYPELVRNCNVRPDIVVTSESSKRMVIIELTVPYETNMSGSHEYKNAKYQELVAQLHKKGFRTQLFAVEVGARGFAGASAYTLLQRLGLSKQKRNRCLRQLSEAAESASYWIWLKRKDQNWTASINSSN